MTKITKVESEDSGEKSPKSRQNGSHKWN